MLAFSPSLLGATLSARPVGTIVLVIQRGVIGLDGVENIGGFMHRIPPYRPSGERYAYVCVSAEVRNGGSPENQCSDRY